MKPTITDSVNQMRRYLSRQIGNGNIPTTGQTPSAPSKVIRMATKDTLWKWIENHQIDWANNYDSDGVVLSEDSDSKTPPPTDEESEGKSGDAKEGDDANSKELKSDKDLPTKIKLPSGDDDYNYITTKGAVTLGQLQQECGAQQLAEGLIKVANSTKGAVDYIHEYANDLNNHIGELKQQIYDLDTSGDITIKINDVEIKTNKDEHYHPKFEAISNYLRWDKQVMLVGRAGTGKTTIANQIAKAFGMNFAHLSCSAGMSEAHLLGRMLFDGEYVLADFVDIYENGGVFLFDEFDAMDGNTAVVINSALANGKMSVPNRKDKPTAYRHKDCYIITASNTWGTGVGDNIYAGRNKLDGATLDRFCASRVHFDYDTKLERKLAPNKDVAKALWTLRKRVDKYRLQRIVSTRLFATANVHTKGGESVEDFFNTVTIDWTDEEKAKVDYDGIITIAKGDNDANSK